MVQLQKIKRTIVLAAAVFILLILTGILGYVRFQAKSLGTNAGQIGGKAVGTAIGSFHGFFEGQAKGKEAGRIEGLSAKDIKAQIKGSIENLGKLEVLSSRFTITDLNELGDDYKALLVIKGKAIFTVDLNKADFSVDSEKKEVWIAVPEPEMTIYFDSRKTKIEAEVELSKWFWDKKTAEDGAINYSQSMNKNRETVKDKISNYEQLISVSKDIAKVQLNQLVTAVCAGNYDIRIIFNGKEI